MGAMKPWHWVVIIVLVLLLFGAKRLPDLARSVGRSMRIFKSEVDELRRDDDGNVVDENGNAVRDRDEDIYRVRTDRDDEIRREPIGRDRDTGSRIAEPRTAPAREERYRAGDHGDRSDDRSL